MYCHERLVFRSYWFNCTTFPSFAVLLQVTESIASDEMLDWGLGVYNTPNRKCVSETAKEFHSEIVHGGQHHLYYFPTVARTRHSSPPTDGILFPHAVSQLWPFAALACPRRALSNP